MVAFDRAHRVLFDEPIEPGPGHRELLPVLWDLGLLPDIQILPAVQPPPTHPTREAAVAGMLQGVSAQIGMDVTHDPRLGDRLLSRFDDVFESTEAGYRMRRDTVPRTLLISWTPRR